MAEDNAVDDALLAALLEVLTRGQLAMIHEQVRQVREHGYGDVTIRVVGERVFVVRAVSFDCGKAQEINRI